MEKNVEKYIDYLKYQKGASNNTILSYNHDVDAFIAYIRSQGINSLAAVDETTVRSFIAYMKNSDKSDASIRRTLVTLRSFFTYMIKSDILEVNPANNVYISPKKDYSPDILTPREINDILSMPDTLTLKGCRDRAILEVLYATGMKATEIISLNFSDVSLATSTIRCGGEFSGTKMRELPLYPEALKALKCYMERAQEALIAADALFVNLNGGRLTRQGFWKIVKQYAEQAGINKTISPDTIRRSFATQLLQNGAEIKMVQELLGLTSITATKQYLKLAKNKFSDVYARCHPRAI